MSDCCSTPTQQLLRYIMFITTKVVSSRPVLCEVYSIQNYVIKFVSDVQPFGGFLRILWSNKTDRHDIAEILLKVALNTIKPNQTTISQED